MISDLDVSVGVTDENSSAGPPRGTVTGSYESKNSGLLFDRTPPDDGAIDRVLTHVATDRRESP
ncbi:hypothetical protein CP556_14315 [Natrinema sp. CBA1119]|nr:hypothetical protein CP556_14315 [Natrinema sp. CBA1119]